MMAGWVIGGLIVVLLALLLQYRKLVKEQNRISQENKTLQRHLLKARIDPHFLFNALSSIQSLVNKNDKESALKYLSRFAALLREIMLEPGDRLIPLEEEMKLLHHYLALESLRFDQPFTWRISALDGIDVHGTEVPLLIVQPFVENAIRHGLAPRGGVGTIEVTFADDGDDIVCTIRDDGIGRQAAGLRLKKESDKPSQGIDITRQRLSLAATVAHNHSFITFRNLYDESAQPCGTEVTVRIPKTNV